jgi:hypothetical protein
LPPGKWSFKINPNGRPTFFQTPKWTKTSNTFNKNEIEVFESSNWSNSFYIQIISNRSRDIIVPKINPIYACPCSFCNMGISKPNN